MKDLDAAQKSCDSDTIAELETLSANFGNRVIVAWRMRPDFHDPELLIAELMFLVRRSLEL